VNAPIRLSSALFALVLSACAANGRSPAPPRDYRQTLVVEPPLVRSAEHPTTTAVRSHERIKPR